MTTDSQVPTRVGVATHGHCFDGAASAALFSRLLTQLHSGQPLSFNYVACGYGPGQNQVDPTALSGEINAILDFRYSCDKRLTWYFDHHCTSFPTPEDRTHFELHRAGGKRFQDAAYGSCSKLIADIGRERFDFAPPELSELVHWADIIDSARFENAAQAVERKEPALQVMTVIEHEGNSSFLQRFVPVLATRGLSEISELPEIQAHWLKLREAHFGFVELVSQRSQVVGDVVLVDLTDRLIDVAGKFVTYAQFPQSLYSVMISKGNSKCKLSIGYNPWAPRPRRHDISAICSRYGGGGHAVVGAISLPAQDVARAQELGRAITEELNT